MATAVGIDLGTTYSCVGVFQHGKVEIIANDQGNRTTPSYVAFNDTERLIGDPAKNQVAMNPINTVFDAKRLIGRKFTDDVVQSDKQHWPFEIINENGRPKIKVEHKGNEKNFLRRGDLIYDPWKDEGNRRSLSWQERQRRRHHSPRLLQRLSATSHQGCRSHCWT